MKPKDIKSALRSLGGNDVPENETKSKDKTVKEHVEYSNVLPRKAIEYIETRLDILDASQGYFTDFFFKKYIHLHDEIISEANEKESNIFFARINDFYSQGTRMPGEKASQQPLEYIYSLLLNKLETKENKIISLRGYHGSGKSKFCEGLFLYFVSKYNESGCVPFIFNSDACLENLSRGKGSFATLKEEFLSLVSLIKRQLTRSKVVLILDGVFDPKQLENDTVMRMIQKEVLELYRHSSFKIIISEDMEDYFLEGVDDERNWLTCKREIMFDGLKKKNKASINSFIKAYCELFVVSNDDMETVLAKVNNSYPLFRIDSKFIRSLMDSKRTFFDIAQYYYSDVFQLDVPEEDRNFDTRCLIEVVKDIFVDGQIDSSWQDRGERELLLILNDDYAFFFFVAYIFFNKWCDCSDFSELENDNIFNEILVNKRFRLLDRRIIFFITFLFWETTTATKMKMVEKFENFVSAVESDWLSMTTKKQKKILQYINALMFVLSKCFTMNPGNAEHQRLRDSYDELFQVLMKFSGNFQTCLILDVWGNDDVLNRTICSFLHCFHYFALAGYHDDATLKVMADSYFLRVTMRLSAYQKILDNMSDSFVAYWGINFNRDDAYECVFNELLFEFSTNNCGRTRFYNELDAVINFEIIRESDDKLFLRDILESFLIEIFKDKTADDFAISGFYSYFNDFLKH